MATLVLFDIDGTLIEVGKANRKAVVDSLKKVADIDLTLKELAERFEGTTEYKIFHDKLKEKGFFKEEIKERIKKLRNLSFKIYKENLKHEKLNLLPGVSSLLRTLHENNVKLGIITGNIEEVGWIKLKQHGLDKYFKIGGFGSDSVERSECLEIAVKRAENYFKTRFDKVFVVGDTGRDSDAAKKIGAITIDVATGIKDRFKDLKKANPDYVFENFKNYKKIAEVILK